MRKAYCLLVLALVMASTSFAQKTKVVSGSVNFLKGVKTLNVQYDYESMGVGDFKSEESYIAQKKKEKNEDEAGEGDKWEEAWRNDKKDKYEPKFEELFHKYNEDKWKLQHDGDSEYTLIVKTVFLEPGFNVGVMRKPARLDIEYRFVKTADPDKTVLKITSDKVPGADAMGFDFTGAKRISEGYAKAGKSLAKFLLKELK